MNKIYFNLAQRIFSILTISGFSVLFILYLYNLKLALVSTTLFIFCGFKFICILITLIHGVFLLSIATLLALVILQPIFDNITFISLILISILAQYTAIRISLHKIGINEKFSNLSPSLLLQFTAISAGLVAFTVSLGFFLLESPPSSVLLLFGLKVLLVEFLSPLMLFRALSFFH
jgi:hypothetical protein